MATREKRERSKGIAIGLIIALALILLVGLFSINQQLDRILKLVGVY